MKMLLRILIFILLAGINCQVLEGENSHNREMDNDLSFPRQLKVIKDVPIKNQLSPQTIKLVLERIRIRKESKRKNQTSQKGSTELPTDFVHSKEFKTYVCNVYFKLRNLENLSVFSKIVICNRVFKEIKEKISQDSQTSTVGPTSENVTDSSIVSTEDSILPSLTTLSSIITTTESTLTTVTTGATKTKNFMTDSTTSPEETTSSIESETNTIASDSTFTKIEKNPATDSMTETTTHLNEAVFPSTTENPDSISIDNDTGIITTTTSILMTISTTLGSLGTLVPMTETSTNISKTSDIDNFTSTSPIPTTVSSNNILMTTNSENTTSTLSLMTDKSPMNVPTILNRDDFGINAGILRTNQTTKPVITTTMTSADSSGTTHTESPSSVTEISTTEPSMDVNTFDDTSNATVNNSIAPTGPGTVVSILSNETDNDFKPVITTTIAPPDLSGTTHTESPSFVTKGSTTEPSMDVSTIDNTNNATVNNFTTTTGTVAPILSNRTLTDSEPVTTTTMAPPDPSETTHTKGSSPVTEVSTTEPSMDVNTFDDTSNATVNNSIAPTGPGTVVSILSNETDNDFKPVITTTIAPPDLSGTTHTESPSFVTKGSTTEPSMDVSTIDNTNNATVNNFTTTTGTVAPILSNRTLTDSEPVTTTTMAPPDPSETTHTKGSSPVTEVSTTEPSMDVNTFDDTSNATVNNSIAPTGPGTVVSILSNETDNDFKPVITTTIAPPDLSGTTHTESPSFVTKGSTTEPSMDVSTIDNTNNATVNNFTTTTGTVAPILSNRTLTDSEPVTTTTMAPPDPSETTHTKGSSPVTEVSTTEPSMDVSTIDNTNNATVNNFTTTTGTVAPILSNRTLTDSEPVTTTTMAPPDPSETTHTKGSSPVTEVSTTEPSMDVSTIDNTNNPTVNNFTTTTGTVAPILSNRTLTDSEPVTTTTMAPPDPSGTTHTKGSSPVTEVSTTEPSIHVNMIDDANNATENNFTGLTGIVAPVLFNETLTGSEPVITTTMTSADSSGTTHTESPSSVTEISTTEPSMDVNTFDDTSNATVNNSIAPTGPGTVVSILSNETDNDFKPVITTTIAPPDLSGTTHTESPSFVTKVSTTEPSMDVTTIDNTNNATVNNFTTTTNTVAPILSNRTLTDSEPVTTTTMASPDPSGTTHTKGSSPVTEVSTTDPSMDVSTIDNTNNATVDNLTGSTGTVAPILSNKTHTDSEPVISATMTPIDPSGTSNTESSSPVAEVSTPEPSMAVNTFDDTNNATVNNFTAPTGSGTVAPILSNETYTDSEPVIKTTLTQTNPSGTSHTDSPSPVTNVSTTEPSIDVSTINDTNNATVSNYTTPTGSGTVISILSNRTLTDSEPVITTTITPSHPPGTTHSKGPSPVTEVLTTEPSMDVSTIDNTNNATVDNFTGSTGTVAPILSNKTHTDSEPVISATMTPIDPSGTSNTESSSPVAEVSTPEPSMAVNTFVDTNNATVNNFTAPTGSGTVAPILSNETYTDSEPVTKTTLTQTNPSGTSHTDSPSPVTNVSTTEPSIDVSTINDTNNATVSNYTTPTGSGTVISILSNRTLTDSEPVITTTITPSHPPGTTHSKGPSPVTEVLTTEPSMDVSTIDNTNNATVDNFTGSTGTVAPILSNNTHTDSEPVISATMTPIDPSGTSNTESSSPVAEVSTPEPSIAVNTFDDTNNATVNNFTTPTGSGTVAPILSNETYTDSEPVIKTSSTQTNPSGTSHTDSPSPVTDVSTTEPSIHVNTIDDANNATENNFTGLTGIVAPVLFNETLTGSEPVITTTMDPPDLSGTTHTESFPPAAEVSTPEPSMAVNTFDDTNNATVNNFTTPTSSGTVAPILSNETYTDSEPVIKTTSTQTNPSGTSHTDSPSPVTDVSTTEPSIHVNTIDDANNATENNFTGLTGIVAPVLFNETLTGSEPVIKTTLTQTNPSGTSHTDSPSPVTDVSTTEPLIDVITINDTNNATVSNFTAPTGSGTVISILSNRTLTDSEPVITTTITPSHPPGTTHSKGPSPVTGVSTTEPSMDVSTIDNTNKATENNFTRPTGPGTVVSILSNQTYTDSEPVTTTTMAPPDPSGTTHTKGPLPVTEVLTTEPSIHVNMIDNTNNATVDNFTGPTGTVAPVLSNKTHTDSEPVISATMTPIDPSGTSNTESSSPVDEVSTPEPSMAVNTFDDTNNATVNNFTAPTGSGTVVSILSNRTLTNSEPVITTTVTSSHLPGTTHSKGPLPVAKVSTPQPSIHVNTIDDANNATENNFTGLTGIVAPVLSNETLTDSEPVITTTMDPPDLSGTTHTESFSPAAEVSTPEPSIDVSTINDTNNATVNTFTTPTGSGTVVSILSNKTLTDFEPVITTTMARPDLSGTTHTDSFFSTTHNSVRLTFNTIPPSTIEPFNGSSTTDESKTSTFTTTTTTMTPPQLPPLLINPSNNSTSIILHVFPSFSSSNHSLNTSTVTNPPPASNPDSLGTTPSSSASSKPSSVHSGIHLTLNPLELILFPKPANSISTSSQILPKPNPCMVPNPAPSGASADPLSTNCLPSSATSPENSSPNSAPNPPNNSSFHPTVVSILL